MSIAARVTELAARIGGECKDLHVEVDGKAPLAHTHTANDVVSGVFAPARIPIVINPTSLPPEGYLIARTQ